MTIAVRGGSGNGQTSGQTLVLNKPAGVVENDGLLVCFFSSVSHLSVTPPSGWTWVRDVFYAGAGYGQVWFKVAGASEPASYTWDAGAGNDLAGGVLGAFSRTIGTIAIDVENGQENTSGTSHPAPSITTTRDGCMLVYLLSTATVSLDDDFITEPSGYIEKAETDNENNTARKTELAYKSQSAAGPTGSPAATTDLATSSAAFLVALAETNISHNGEASLQAVASLSAEGSYTANAQAELIGVTNLLAEADATPFLDFTVYDAYIKTDAGLKGLLFYDQAQPETTPIELQPTRTDVGNNPEEIRPEFGNFFAQSDFSHGAGQHYFHQPGRDPKRFMYSEGFDISEPGRLTHLRALAEAFDSASVGRGLTQAGGLPFLAVANRVRRGDGAFPGTWTEENPHVAEGDQTVKDLAAEGARVFAALGVNGVHVRSSGGTWAHLQPDGSTDLNISPAERVAWLKERLMVVGGTGGRSLYEVNPTGGTSTPTAIETLPEGWVFEHIFEASGFIHACAVNVDAGLSRVHHYGLNSAGSAIEKKSSTPFPQGQLMYAGCGFPGLAFVGGGKANASGGYDPILYRALVNPDTGALEYVEVREEKGSGSADLSVRAVVPIGESILFGWSLASGAFGGARDGIGIYHVARDAFAHHLKRTGAGGNELVLAIMPFKGRVLITFNGDGLYYEDLATYATTAVLVTSHADWNNAGQKVWDLIEVSHEPLPAGTSVKVEYGIKSHELSAWTTMFTSDIDGSEGQEGRISGVKSRLFALRITSTSTASASPVFLGYSVRSLPSPAQADWRLVRYVRLLATDRKDEDSELIYQDPRELLRFLQDALWSFVTFHESGFSWAAFVEDVSTVEPKQPFYDTTSGEAVKDAFVVRLQMVGTR